MIPDLPIAAIAQAKRALAELREREAALALAIQASETERRSAVAKRGDLLARATEGEEIDPVELAAATTAIGAAEARTAERQEALSEAVATIKASERRLSALLNEALRRCFPDAQHRAEAAMRDWQAVEAEFDRPNAKAAAE